MRKKTILMLAVLLFVFSFFTLELYAKKTKAYALVGATLIDGTGAGPIKNAVIVIEKERIKAVGPKSSVEIPEGAKTIDVSGKWILPGFIDLHIHLTYPLNMEMELSDYDSLRTLRALNVMNKYLRSGVTSVRDVTSHMEPMRALKQAATLKYTDTIRLYSVGEGIVSTGGHGDILSASEAASGADGWREAVRVRKKMGFNYIKLLPPYTVEELRAAVDEAKTWGMRTIGHAGSPSDMMDPEPPFMSHMAVENGVQCLEHPGMITDETLELMAKKNVHLVPTMAVMRMISKAMTKQAMEQYRQQYRNFDKLAEYMSLESYEHCFKKAKELGVVLGVGTDFVMQWTVKYPDCFFEELKYFVELGFSRLGAISCATKNGGIILGLEDSLGTLEPGKYADLQVIEGDPLKSFDVLGNPEIVITGGKIHQFPKDLLK